MIRKKTAIVSIGTMIIFAMIIAPVISANPGGHLSDNLNYDCGGSCHTTQSTATMVMAASNLTPTPGQDLTVFVNISGGEPIGLPLGVMIIKSLSPANSMPSNDGWNIISDPSGSTTFNYYEIGTYTGQASLQWSLKAPLVEGNYSLFARVMHGNGSAYYRDDTIGLFFEVSTTPSPAPTLPVSPKVMITSPLNGANLTGTINISSNIIISSNKSIQYVVLRIDGTIKGNLTSAPFSWTIDTNELTDGTHKCNITAVDSDGKIGYKEVTINVLNEAERALMTSWIGSIIVGTVAIVCIVGTMVIVVLLIRERKIERGLK